MVEQTRRQAQELRLEGIYSSHRPVGNCQASNDNGQQKASGICIMLPSYAKASTTEEPDAGKPHVRDWAGGAG